MSIFAKWQFSTGTHTRTREEAINAAGNVIGNVTVNVSCV